MVDTSPLRPRSSQRYRATCGLSLRRGSEAVLRGVRPRSASPLRHNVDVRKVLIRLGSTLAVVLVAAVIVDFGTTVFAEYRFARSVRAAAQLNWDPSVAILGFPFIPQAMRQHYSEVEIKANDVKHQLVGKASLEATMHSIDLTDSSWLIGPDAKLPVGKLESRIIIDSAHLGRFMGITDLIVEAPSGTSTTPPGLPPNPVSPTITAWCLPGPPRRRTSTRRSACRWTCR